MTKVVVRRRRDNRRPGRNSYRAFGVHGTEEHPIDVAVEQRLQHAALRRQIVRLQEKILDALDNDRRPMLQLDELWNDVRAEREEAYFNLGFEHGFAAGRTRLDRGTPRPFSRAVVALGERIRAELLNAEVDPSGTMLALADALWVTAVRYWRP